MAYGSPQGMIKVFPLPIISTRAPTTSDTGYALGQDWIRKTTNQAWKLTSVVAGSATWALSSPGASDVDTLTGDAGGPISPLAGDIVLAGGTNIASTGAINTITFDLDAAIDLATSVTSPLYTSGAGVDTSITAPAGQDIILQMGDAAGANKVSFVDSASAEVFAVDSNGTIAALAGLTVTGALTQTAGAVSIAQDNAADAVDIAGGNVARAITLGATGAHTLDIGSAAAGAIAIDSAAGISLDGATASNFTVTGAAQDLTVSSVGGSVNVLASQAAVDAIAITASDAAGGIDVNAGTGGITIDSTGAISIDGAVSSNISVAGAGIDMTVASAAGRVVLNGEEAAADAVTILSAAGGLDTNVALQMNLDSSQAAADAVRIIASGVAGGIDVDSGTGGITIDSTGIVSIDGAGAMNFTATGAFDVTTSSTAGSVIVSGGEAAADAVQITASDAGAGGVLVTSGIGGIALNSTGAAAPITLDSTGTLELNSSTAAISIGNDDIDQAVNIGTDGERTVTVGSVNGAAATVIQSGTGEITVTGTVKQIDAELIGTTGIYIPAFTMNSMVNTAANTGGVATGATGNINNVMLQTGVNMNAFVIGAGQTILQPIMGANGLIVSADQTNTEGMEYNFPYHQYTIGTSDPFMFELGLYINDMDGASPYVFGFRKVEANNAVMTDYTDYATIGMIAGTSVTEIVTSTELNSGGNTITNTTDLWGGDGTTNTLAVLVDAAGNVTYTINGAAPTNSAAFQFDNGDIVIPFLRVVHSASPTTVAITSKKIGSQA